MSSIGSRLEKKLDVFRALRLDRCCRCRAVADCSCGLGSRPRTAGGAVGVGRDAQGRNRRHQHHAGRVEQPSHSGRTAGVLPCRRRGLQPGAARHVRRALSASRRVAVPALDERPGGSGTICRRDPRDLVGDWSPGARVHLPVRPADGGACCTGSARHHRAGDVRRAGRTGARSGIQSRAQTRGGAEAGAR